MSERPDPTPTLGERLDAEARALLARTRHSFGWSGAYQALTAHLTGLTAPSAGRFSRIEVVPGARGIPSAAPAAGSGPLSWPAAQAGPAAEAGPAAWPAPGLSRSPAPPRHRQPAPRRRPPASSPGRPASRVLRPRPGPCPSPRHRPAGFRRTSGAACARWPGPGPMSCGCTATPGPTRSPGRTRPTRSPWAPTSTSGRAGWRLTTGAARPCSPMRRATCPPRSACRTPPGRRPAAPARRRSPWPGSGPCWPAAPAPGPGPAQACVQSGPVAQAARPQPAAMRAAADRDTSGEAAPGVDLEALRRSVVDDLMRRLKTEFERGG